MKQYKKTKYEKSTLIILIVLTWLFFKDVGNQEKKSQNRSELAVNVNDKESMKQQEARTNKTPRRNRCEIRSKIDSEGKFVPFKYQNTKDGKPQTIEVNGNES
jgi:hypothetical protein